jgi:glycosyltransferase involved in cell wall biosynthesis
MRILMLAPEPFLEPRGTPFSVYHRAKALITLGYEVDLVTYPMGKPIRISGLRIYRAPALPFIQKVKIGPSFAKLPLDLSVFLTALWRLCSGRYRYIHTHEEAGLMGVLLASIFNCKHLYDMHSDLPQQMSNFAFTKNHLLIRCIEFVQTLIVRHADVVIAICPELEHTVKKIAPEKPVFMIENVAVDEMLPPPQADDVQRLREKLSLVDHPVLLYTGTLESYQGIDLLIKSAAIVRSEFPNVRYVVVGGKAAQIEKQQRLVQELALGDTVLFEGQHPLEEMPLYMALADILLSPRSIGTNTPLKLYTYLRSGKPILATSIPSHTQILTPEMAVLVHPTAAGLAEGAMGMLHDLEKARALGTHARSVAEERYNRSAFLEKTGHAYSVFTGIKKRKKSSIPETTGREIYIEDWSR